MKARAANIRSKIAWVIAIILAAGALAGFGTIGSMEYRATAMLPEDTNVTDIDGETAPEIDWDYWLAVNGDIIGWVTVPDTNIDSAIVQAHADDPEYYLSHDVYGNWNYCGCPYLDYHCADDGLNAKNATIFGHHLRSETMFSAFSNYSDRDFALAHQKILLQTPDWKKVVYVSYVNVVDANIYSNPLIFENDAAYTTWYAQCLTEADVVLDERIPEHNYTFVTCSYSTFDDERTLVVACEAPDAPTAS